MRRAGRCESPLERRAGLGQDRPFIANGPGRPPTFIISRLDGSTRELSLAFCFFFLSSRGGYISNISTTVVGVWERLFVEKLRTVQ
jgi:hypothetical protein